MGESRDMARTGAGEPRLLHSGARSIKRDTILASSASQPASFVTFCSKLSH